MGMRLHLKVMVYSEKDINKIYEGATIYLGRKESVFHHIPDLNVEDIVRSPVEISESQAEMT